MSRLRRLCLTPTATVLPWQVPGFVQAHHLDTDSYDAKYQEGSCLETHARHFDVWHGSSEDMANLGTRTPDS